MSLPDLAPTPPPTRPDSTAVTAILDAAAQHRLHAAMVLVGVHRVPAPVVLDLVWPQIHPEACETPRARLDRAPRPGDRGVAALAWLPPAP